MSDTIPVSGLRTELNGKYLDLAESATSVVFSGGTADVTELAVDMEDPGLLRMHSGLLVVGKTDLNFNGEKLVLAAVEASGGASGQGALKLQFRPRSVRALKRRRGAHVLRGVSASEYVQSECRSIGVPVFAQATAKRTQIARDVPAANEPPVEGADYPSAWTTFQRLAQEEGFLMYQAVGTIVFARPSWLLAKRGVGRKIVWQNGKDSERPLEHPTCRRSEDAPTLVEIGLKLPWEMLNGVQPGQAIELDGVPGFGGKYLVSQISYSPLHDGTVDVTAGSAIDPKPTEVQGTMTTQRGVGKFKTIADAALAAGFRGQDLQIAVAVSLAETGGTGDPKTISKPNVGGTAPGSRDWGLWQINDHFHSFDKVLILSAVYNAKQAYAIWLAGPPAKSWTPWTTYRSGAYKKWMDEAAEAIATDTTVAFDSTRNGGNSATHPGPSHYPTVIIENPAQRGWGPAPTRQGQPPVDGLERVDCPGGAITVNRIAAPLYRELIRLLLQAGYSKLSSAGGGGYIVKGIPGSALPSNHSWGLACDFNPRDNPYRNPLTTDMPRNVREIAHSVGMRWGGDYHRLKDPMHFEVMLSRSEAITLAKRYR